jgi:CBS domain-containing protein
MSEVVTQMRDLNISSVLVLDHVHEVVGIITERDIVHRFTLLDLKHKLNSKAFAVMSRPVVMARLDHLFEDVRQFFSEKKLRHFPISSGGTHANDVLGIVTVTDLAAAWLQYGYVKQGATGASEMIVVVVGQPESRELYGKLLKALSIEPVLDADNELLIRRAIDFQLPVILDLDGIEVNTSKTLLQRLKGHSRPVLLLTSHENLVEPLRRVFNLDVFQVVLKPLEVAEVMRLLSRVDVKSKAVSST